MNVYLKNKHSLTALSVDPSDGDNIHITFMSNTFNERGLDGNSGPYSIAANRTQIDFRWLRWSFNNKTGIVSRATTINEKVNSARALRVSKGPS